MKRITSFLIALSILSFLSISLYSCSDDDETESSLIGLWTFVNYTAEIENPTNKQELESEKSMIAFASLLLQGTTIEFKADNTFNMIAVSETYKGTYSKDGIKYIISINDEENTVDEDEIFSSGSFITLNNGALTITDDILDNEYRSKGFTKYVVKMSFKK